ncbi:hypothetical protein Pmani_007476 [Petrolisthes manimaculis]|uniref:Uncharacterized protein n=1 Tax=Petrolisthes manimaculis TaxID=1843537 RepID=A0AAE1Q8A7_9EUCA|nr:hypothetical protein Pmani_007476 [Petrolisthes manimaculis]
MDLIRLWPLPRGSHRSRYLDGTAPDGRIKGPSSHQRTAGGSIRYCTVTPGGVSANNVQYMELKDIISRALGKTKAC